MAIVSWKSFIKQSLLFMADTVYDKFGRGTTWSAGQLLRVTPDQTVESIPAVRFLTVASTDADITNAKGAGFSQIFNTWERLSYNAGVGHSNPTEENAWTYDSTTGQVTCTVNSVAVLGFIGPDYYDKYTMEVGISSTAEDDDSIGLCLGYVSEGGVDHMLMVSRQGGSGHFGVADNISKLLNIVYNSDITNRTGWLVTSVSGTLSYPDGTKPAGPGGLITLQGTHGNWPANGEITLKVERTPTTITVWSSDKGSPRVYSDANKVTVDLTSDDRLSRFIHPCRIGYLAESQQNSTYKVYTQPDFQVPIFDVRDSSMWQFEGGAWVHYATGAQTIKDTIPQGITISSIANNSLWFATYTATLRRLTQ